MPVPDTTAMVGTWFQVSRRFCTVARLPAGKSGIQALAEASIDRRSSLEHILDTTDWAVNLGENSAAEQYLRCHAPSRDKMTLTTQQFNAFRKAGGGTYR